jgi:hypothetical protein
MAVGLYQRGQRQDSRVDGRSAPRLRTIALSQRLLEVCVEQLMTYGAQKDKEFPRLLGPRNNLLFLKAQRHGRVPQGLTPPRGTCIALLYPSEHRCPILSSLSEPLSKQLVSVLVPLHTLILG